jgi:hypothetical protein
MGQPEFRGDKKQKKLEKELEDQGPELRARMRRAKAYQEELQHDTIWANERIAQGLSPNSRHMTSHIQEHPMVAQLRADPRLGKPPYGYGTPHYASRGQPPLNPFQAPVHNPNEIFYVSPGGGLKLTLGELKRIGRVMSDDEWLNKNTRQDLPDYTAACLDMYYSGLGIREGLLTLGVIPSLRTPVYKPYPLEYRADGRSYNPDTAGRNVPRPISPIIPPRPPGIPPDWITENSKKGGGITYVNPKNTHDRVRVMPGKPKSPFPAQRSHYVKR